MVRPKPKSKRTPVRLRHKIEKRSNEKQRKERRDAKKHPELHRKKKEKLNIPNSFPYKDRLLSEIEEGKRLREEDAVKRREEARKRRKAQEGGDEGMDISGDEGLEEEFDSEEEEEDEDAMEEDGDEGIKGNSAMSALLASARARALEYESAHPAAASDSDSDSSPHPLPRAETSRKAFDKLYKSILDTADVILYILDARDPNGTRSRQIEREIAAASTSGKRLILILNKIDLVPAGVLKSWLSYLRRYFPTLPLKASSPAGNAVTFEHGLTTKGTAQTLLKALKAFAASTGLKRKVTVGVLGYPNVGKSSVINALTGRLGGTMSACPTGAEAGVTTSLREVKLDGKLNIIDSPGIVFPSSTPSKEKDSKARLILLNAVPPKQINDPVPAVTLLLQRLSTQESLFAKLLEVYDLPPLVNTTSADMTTDFLVQVARKRGRLGRGGVPNIQSAAQTVITDWRDGRIQGWVEPPVITGSKSADLGGMKVDTTEREESKDRKEIVTEWAKEFKLEGLWGEGEVEEGEGQVMMLE
ncbi:nuclear GTP-binding protein nug1 [Rhizina undulata]